MNSEHQPSSTPPSRDENSTSTEARLKALEPQPLAIDMNSLEDMLIDRRIGLAAPTSLAEQNVPRPWGALAVAWSLGVAVGILCMLFLRPPSQPSPLVDAAEPETPPGISRQEANSQGVEEFSAAHLSSRTPESRASAAQSLASSSSQAILADGPADSFARRLRAGTHLFTHNASLAHSASPSADLDLTSPSVYKPSYRSHADALEATSLPQHRCTPRNLLRDLLEGHGNHVL